MFSLLNIIILKNGWNCRQICRLFCFYLENVNEQNLLKQGCFQPTLNAGFIFSLTMLYCGVWNLSIETTRIARSQFRNYLGVIPSQITPGVINLVVTRFDCKE